MGKKMVPNQPLNGNTVGGSGSFKAWPGYIVLPDRQRRMEFAGGCQKVSILCERLNPLFTALSRAQAPFVLLLLSPLASLFSLSVRRICARRFLPKVSNQATPMHPSKDYYPEHTTLSRHLPSLHRRSHPDPRPCQKEPLNDVSQKKQQGRNSEHKGIYGAGAWKLPLSQHRFHSVTSVTQSKALTVIWAYLQGNH